MNSSVYGTTLADIQAKGELVIGLDDTFASMGFRDESGNLVGFEDVYKRQVRSVFLQKNGYSAIFHFTMIA